MVRLSSGSRGPVNASRILNSVTPSCFGVSVNVGTSLRRPSGIPPSRRIRCGV